MRSRLVVGDPPATILLFQQQNRHLATSCHGCRTTSPGRPLTGECPPLCSRSLHRQRPHVPADAGSLCALTRLCRSSLSSDAQSSRRTGEPGADTPQGRSRGRSRQALLAGGGWTLVRTSHRGTGSPVLRSRAISLHLLWPFLGLCTPHKQSPFPSRQHKGFLSLRVTPAGLHTQFLVRVWTHYFPQLLPVLLGGRAPEAKNRAIGTAALPSRGCRSRSSRGAVRPLRDAGKTDTWPTRLAGTGHS